MRRASFFLLSTVASVLVLSACSQQASRVPVYKYGQNDGGAGSLGIHTFHSGDTLWSVANAYHVDLRDMLDLNKLSAPYRIKAGQRLRIPAPLEYKTRQGDTLYRVSRMFDATTTELARLNHLQHPYVLRSGQVLRLPSKHTNNALVIKSVPQSVQMEIAKLPPMEKIQKEELQSSLPPSPSLSSSSVAPEVEKILPQNKVEKVADISPPTTRSGKGFLKPVSGKIISGFGTKADGLHNDGVNIKATRGDPVRSAENGVVVYSGNQIEGYGNMMLIRHADGYMTAYAHMDKMVAKKGDRVSRGQAIGTVGSTGHVDAPQLHFEIRKGRDAINPAPYL